MCLGYKIQIRILYMFVLLAIRRHSPFSAETYNEFIPCQIWQRYVNMLKALRM